MKETKEPVRKSSFEKLRRDAFVHPDDDLLTLLEMKTAQPLVPPPVFANEADRFFSAIVGQILAETDALGGRVSGGSVSQSVGNLQDALGLYRQT